MVSLEVRRAAVLGEVESPKNHKIRWMDMSPQLAETLQRLKEIMHCDSF